MKKVTKKPKVYAIVGPTGVGKTSLSIALAKAIDGEIISADSRQVYTHLDIGTEKVTSREMRGITHHLLSVCHPRNAYTVADFTRDATQAMSAIQSRNHVPIIVGGTGWYIDALLYGQTLPDVPPNTALRRNLEVQPTETLYTLLKKLDPNRARSIDRHNPRRLIRAIEIARALGKVPKVKKRSRYNVTWLGVLPPENYQHQLLSRLKKQIRKGLLKEVQALLDMRLSQKRINELGLEYRTGLQFLKGEISRDAMIEKMSTELAQLAKRQMRWFKRNPHIIWNSYQEHLNSLTSKN